ncbi:hypothetical protein J2S13_001915 [Oikeobacillus pervagus]|uniref:Hemerythrin-like domain-containing protein n=1 Tax=Oikeobacillus pervagus TaxID=1325931 RepID=A0AAJ1T2B0_9BACI|nr:hemerythrin domain-containing protein [Oikeobacillus pervagus]MDQ0215497.1 hypothetical protein [Oikeobacillus pervagus]
MSGPSLRQLHAHRSIHDGAYSEAKSLTDLLLNLVKDHKEKEALEVADALVEHWEQRVIGHADSEEEGFYLEVTKNNPKLHDKIIMLTRDHDIIRTFAREIREELKKNKVTENILDRFKALLLINKLHSRDEERFVFKMEENS